MLIAGRSHEFGKGVGAVFCMRRGRVYMLFMVYILWWVEISAYAQEEIQICTPQCDGHFMSSSIPSIFELVLRLFQNFEGTCITLTLLPEAPLYMS